jgi:hypothetical protein
MILVRAALALVLLSPAPARAEDASALTLAAAFCAAVRASDEAAAEALMPPELQAAIAALRDSDARFRTAYPGDKPPLGDGLALTAYQDYPESCTPEEVSSASVVLAYVPAGAPDGVWRDQLELVTLSDGSLRVADIRYAPDGNRRFSGWLAEAAVWE